MEPPESQPLKVNFYSHRTFISSCGYDLKETLLPDDPFRHLHDQSPGKRVLGLLKYFAPMFEWGPKYSFADFRYDLLAGITIASLAIPQGISYARLASLPPIIGLYSSFVPPLVYAIFGSSTNLAVGTIAGASLLLASIIQTVASPDEDPQLYLNLVLTAAFFTGIIQAALGILRLGILVDFLSRSTITGFMGGTACIVILQQLKGFLGMKHFTTKTDVVSAIHALVIYKHEWRWESAVLGLIFFVFLVLCKNIRSKFPKLFWVSVLGPLAVVIVGCIFSYLAHGENHGIQIVGPLAKGLNPVTISDLNFQYRYLGTVLKASVITGFLALSEGIAVGRSLGLLKNEQIDGNKEMIAFGFMNIFGSFFSCYFTTGPFSKSAVNYHAGCRTPMANAVMAVCMMLVLLFLAPFFSYTPLVALSAIISVAMLGLIEFHEAHRLFKVDKYDFCVCMAAFVGVLFFNMSIGLAVSVSLSLLRALLYVARPTACRLGNVGGRDLYRDTQQYPDADLFSDVLILKLGSPIYFATAGYLKQRILRWVEEQKGEPLQHVIFDLGGVTAIDSTGIEMLLEVHRNLKKEGVQIALTDPRLSVAEKLMASGYIEQIGGEENVFLSIEEAVAACRRCGAARELQCISV